MTSRLGPRFAAEATFILAVAVVAGLLSLGWVGVVVAMAAAWVAVAVVEVSMSRGPDDKARPEPGSDADAELEVPAEPLVAEPGEPPRAEPAPSPPEWDDRDPRAPADELEPLPERVVLPPEREPDEGRKPVAASDEGEREHEREVAAAREDAEAQPAAVEATASGGGRRINLWDLEVRAREHAGKDPVRDEERAYLLIYLREFADVDGAIPPEFDELVRQSFGDILEGRL